MVEATHSLAVREQDTLEHRVQLQIAQVFQVAQGSTQTGNRKHLITLYKLQQECALDVEETPKGTRLRGEKIFNVAFTKRAVYKILGAAKGQPWADKSCRFVASFSALCLAKSEQSGLEQRDQALDNTATRFAEYLLRVLIKGMSAADKTVRFRATQMAAQILATITAMDECLFNDLKRCILQRTEDREVSVRLQTVLALARLSTDEDNDITAAQIRMMKCDKSAEVRRLTVLNSRLGSGLMSCCLERSRDTDPSNRRAVFAKFVPVDAADESTKRQMSFDVLWRQQTESLIALLVTGLQDTDPGVAQSARKLASHVVASSATPINAFIQVLMAFKAEEEQQEEVMRIFFEETMTRNPALAKALSTKFEHQHWPDVNVGEARCFKLLTRYYRTTKNEEALDLIMPVLTAHALCIESIASKGIAPSLSWDARTMLLNEMLSIGAEMDFADEQGRRKMYETVGSILRSPTISEKSISPAIEILRKTYPCDGDFVGCLVKAIYEISKLALDLPARFDGAAEGEASRNAIKLQVHGQSEETNITLRCLRIASEMLQRLDTHLDGRSPIFGLLESIVIPSIKTKNVSIREAGIKALGLTCLLDRELASQNIALLVNQSQTAHGTLQCLSLQYIVDLLAFHGMTKLFPTPAAALQMERYLLWVLTQGAGEIQDIAAQGIAKLILTRQLVDEEHNLVKCMLLLALKQVSATSHVLVHCLEYFIPAFSFSATQNQALLQNLIPELILELAADKQADADPAAYQQIVERLVFWSDPRELHEAHEQTENDLGHIGVLLKFLKLLFDDNCENFRRPLAANLTRLYIPSVLPENCRRLLITTVAGLLESRVHKEFVSTALQKLLPSLEAASTSTDSCRYWEAEAIKIEQWLNTLRQARDISTRKLQQSRKKRPTTYRLSTSRALERELESLQDSQSVAGSPSSVASPSTDDGMTRGLRRTPARKAALRSAHRRQSFGGFSDSDEDDAQLQSQISPTNSTFGSQASDLEFDDDD